MSEPHQIPQPLEKTPGGSSLQQYALDHIHYAGPSRGPAEQTEKRCPRVAQYMFGPADSRTGSGSARSRLPSGRSLSRSRAASLVKEWHAETKNLATVDSGPRGRQVVLYKLADTCTTLTRQYRGAVGNVARALRGALVGPPIDATNIRRYFGDLEGFGAIKDLITIVTRGVPVKVAPARADLERALRYDNHRSAAEHLPAI